MADDRKPISFPSQSDMPERAMSLASMLWNHTGSWRYLRPRYDDKTPPCNEGCPAGNDIEQFIRAIEARDYPLAFRILKEENPIPRVTGRVCFHPCEQACNRREFDRPTSIQALERFAADHGSSGFKPEKVKDDSGKTVAVVGSGPSGLAAAYHLARMGHAVTVFDEQDAPGGVLRVGIPEYRLPNSVLAKDIADIEALGVVFKLKTTLGKDLTLADLRERFDAVYLATGVHRSRALGIPGEDAKGVMSGLSMLRTINMGGKPPLGRRVCVIGGGNTAVDAARAALRFGSHVELLYRRSRMEMPAHADEIDEAHREGVAMTMLSTPVEVRTDGDRVTGLRCAQMRLGPPDESGRRRPEAIDGLNFDVDCDTVITAIGEEADLEFAGTDVRTDAGMIAVDDWGQTSLPDVFAGGDVADVQHTVVDAIGTGKRAAISIDRFLAGDEVRQPYPAVGSRKAVSIGRYLGRDLTHKYIGGCVVGYETLNTAYFEQAPRGRVPHVPAADGSLDFHEVVGTLDENQAQADAARCFHCGVCTMCDNCWVFCPDVAIAHKPDGEFGYDIDLDYCKGCGICVHECPRNAMAMEGDQ